MTQIEIAILTLLVVGAIWFALWRARCSGYRDGRASLRATLNGAATETNHLRAERDVAVAANVRLSRENARLSVALRLTQPPSVVVSPREGVVA